MVEVAWTLRRKCALKLKSNACGSYQMTESTRRH